MTNHRPHPGRPPLVVDCPLCDQPAEVDEARGSIVCRTLGVTVDIDTPTRSAMRPRRRLATAA